MNIFGKGGHYNTDLSTHTAFLMLPLCIPIHNYYKHQVLAYTTEQAVLGLLPASDIPVTLQRYYRLIVTNFRICGERSLWNRL